MSQDSDKNIKFRPKDGKWEAYDANSGKVLGYVEDMSNVKSDNQIDKAKDSKQG